jgi:hypothetical protein
MLDKCEYICLTRFKGWHKGSRTQQKTHFFVNISKRKECDGGVGNLDAQDSPGCSSAYHYFDQQGLFVECLSVSS